LCSSIIAAYAGNFVTKNATSSEFSSHSRDIERKIAIKILRRLKFTLYHIYMNLMFIYLSEKIFTFPSLSPYFSVCEKEDFRMRGNSLQKESKQSFSCGEAGRKRKEGRKSVKDIAEK
jgi:hypothetical protein